MLVLPHRHLGGRHPLHT